MESWAILPDASIRAQGPNSAAFLELGYDSFRGAAQYLHQLPYGRNADRADYRLVLHEKRGTCSTKHALLAGVALEQGLPVSLMIGIYDMNDANTPGVGNVLAAHELESIPEAHCYLSYAGRLVDITRSDATPKSPIAHFHNEWTIEPFQIGAHKLALHQQYLRDWLSEHRHPKLTFEALWSIREECIQALSAT